MLMMRRGGSAYSLVLQHVISGIGELPESPDLPTRTLEP